MLVSKDVAMVLAAVVILVAVIVAALAIVECIEGIRGDIESALALLEDVLTPLLVTSNARVPSQR